MLDPELATTLMPVVALYAETHFRFFKGFPSLLFRREPEVIFDLPRRLGPGCDLPIMLLLNDIDRFPAEVVDVQVTVSHGPQTARVISVGALNASLLSHPLGFQSACYLFTVPRDDLHTGVMYINARATIRLRNRTVLVLNDNLFGTTKFSFRCEVSDQQFPGQSECSYGDLHIHSQFSQSHVEFGPPVQVIGAMSEAYGLDFAAVTDHSYDLFCSMTDYLAPDGSQERWRRMEQSITQCTSKTLLIPGEEVSCLNDKGLAVHLLGLGLHRPVPGSLDGARKGRSRETQLTVEQCVDDIHDQGGVAFAAHPGSHAGLLQRLLLSRGTWTEADMCKKLDGLQALNGAFERKWSAGKALWLQKLRKGSQLSLAAGNDCHGDFNRYRCIKTPFLSIGESQGQFFGASRTGIYGKHLSIPSLLNALAKGQTFVTNGPFLDIVDRSIGRSLIGRSSETHSNNVEVVAVGSSETGAVLNVKVWGLPEASNTEVLVLSKSYDGNLKEQREPLALADGSRFRYLRAELTTRVESDRSLRTAVTSCAFLM